MHKKQHHPDWENTCNYCLYLQYAPRSSRSGNCTLHRQWIQRSAFTTCSDMSVQPLDEGIYTLTAAAYGGWVHQRRHKLGGGNARMAPGRLARGASRSTRDPGAALRRPLR